jgi:hypothetical protein
MKLKFRAKPGMCTPWPNSHFAGQPRRFVGREFIAGDEFKRVPASYKASEDPAEIESGSADADHLIRKCRKGELWAADVATAAECGIAFVELAKGEEGEWFQKAAPAAVTEFRASKRDSSAKE